MTKTILITGSTDGIGKLGAIKLAKQGHQLYLHGRNKQKLDDTILDIKEVSQNKNIFGCVADFTDLGQVNEMAKAIRQSTPKLDVLINNAGVFKSSVAESKEGIDIRIVVNYLAPYLLTRELLPILEKGVSPRIINLSSAAQATVSLYALKGNQELSVQEAYSQSKLALTMWSFDLAKRQAVMNDIAVNPGSLLNTKMVAEAYGKYWSPASKGANILCDLAISEEYNDASGKYFDNDKGEEKGTFAPAHADAYQQEKIDALIVVTNTLLSKHTYGLH